MIGIKFRGRLGNQLFQYQYFKYIRYKHKDTCVFFVNPHHAYLTKYFDLSFYSLFLGSKIYSLITRNIPKIRPFKEIHIQNFVAPKERVIEDQTIINGFFQSDWYLKNTPEKFDMKIKRKYVAKFNETYGELYSKNKVIVVHIRRTDYLTYNNRDISLPIEYFKKQLNTIENLDSYKVIFVSDDIPFVKLNFQERSNFIYSENDEITDFQIIQNADIAIISNSTFAWWAAYLSEKKNTVIAPKYWLGFRLGREHPKGIMTDRFVWREVI